MKRKANIFVLSPLQRKVLDALTDGGKHSLEELGRRLNTSAASVGCQISRIRTQEFALSYSKTYKLRPGDSPYPHIHDEWTIIDGRPQKVYWADKV